jgi:hypothetical protein
MAGLRAGVSARDITPTFPIRLNGYDFECRKQEAPPPSSRILWAKALAISSGNDRCVLVTVDNCAIPESVTEFLAGHLEAQNIPRERLAVCYTHTHAAPCLTGAIPGLIQITDPVPESHQKHVSEYTERLKNTLVEVAMEALGKLSPAEISWAQGKAMFAVNRRRGDGPVDHDLPMLRVKDLSGDLQAVFLSYACHCVNVQSNTVSGDWAGFAQECIQKSYPGAEALVAIGCAGDANPRPMGDGNEVAQGQAIADEVTRLVREDTWRLVQNFPNCYLSEIQLPRQGMPEPVPYPVQTWRFGDDLAIIFLAGEPVADYARRLKTDYVGRPLWINGYSACCDPGYIPSECMVREAQGRPNSSDYEVVVANTRWYRLEQPYTPEVQQLILKTVKSHLRNV